MELKEVKTYYNNGQLFEHCFLNENGEFHGEYKARTECGQMWIQCFYDNGKYHGEYKRWHSNGQLWDHCFYINSKEITEKEYYDSRMKEKLEKINEWDNIQGATQ